MQTVKRILMPTDFSENAHQALRYGGMLADNLGAELTLLHVIALFQDDPKNVEQHFPQMGEFYSKMERNAAFRMNEFTFDYQHLRTQNVTTRSISPAEEIVNYASDHDVDLIVMGTHGRSAVSHFLVGSVAERVVRHAHCPVLTVSHQEKQMYTFPRIARILVPVDFSHFSRQAVTYATNLAKPLGASLVFLNVVDQRVYPDYHYAAGQPLRAVDPEIFEKSMTSLKDLVGSEVPGHLTGEVFVREGKPHSEIVAFAKKNNIDLIVMGTHGLSGLDRWLIGSTTEKVVRKSDNPVLCVKSDGKALGQN